MKRLIAVYSIFILGAIMTPCVADAAIMPWWLQPTICRPNPTSCYAVMGAGFDSGLWDSKANCWGMKYICPAALNAGGGDPVAVSKIDITAGTGIKPDFDTGTLNYDCFGARKTIASGSQASVNGNYVNVWCNGVLGNPDETLATGEITLGTQPTCKTLAADGYVATLNQNCYGKYYDPGKYYIECEGSNLLPTRLITLNDASPVLGVGSPPTGYPIDAAAAKTLFDKMYSNSAAQHAKYF